MYENFAEVARKCTKRFSTQKPYCEVIKIAFTNVGKLVRVHLTVDGCGSANQKKENLKF